MSVYCICMYVCVGVGQELSIGNIDMNVNETCRQGKSEGRPTRERKPAERNETRATDEPRTTLQQQKQVRMRNRTGRFVGKMNESIIHRM